MSGGRLVGDPGVVVGVLPEVAALAVPAVQPGRPALAELLRGAEEELVGGARRHVVDEELARGRAHRHGPEERAVLVEVGVDEEAGQVPVPGRRAGQRARRGVVARPAAVDGVLAVVRPGGGDAGLDHVAPAELVHLVAVAGSRDVPGEGGRVLAQPLPVEGVVAEEDADVERPVAPLDGVVELDALGAVPRLDRHRLAGRLLLDARGVVRPLGVPRDRRGEPPAGHRDEAPAVRAADELLLVLVPLVAHVQLVPDARAEGEVVGDLRGVAEEVLVVELRAVAHDAAARLHPVHAVAVPIDEGLDERVVRGLAGHRGRNRQSARGCPGC